MRREITRLLGGGNYVLDTLVDRFHSQVLMCVWLRFNGSGATGVNVLIVSPQENALNGDHLWMETSCSGELCYLGEDTCLLKTAVSVCVCVTL